MGPKKNMCVFRGAAKNYIESNFALSLQVDNNCKNGHILFVFVSNNESHQLTIEQVNKLYGFNICYSHTKLLVNVSKKWACNFLRDSKHFVDFCNEPFICQAATFPATDSFQSGPSSSKTVSYLSVASSPKHKSILSSPNKKSPLLSRLRADQLTPRKKLLKHRLSVFATEIATEKRKHREDVKVLKEKIKTRPRFKHLNETIARKEKTIRSLRNKLKVQRLNLQLNKLQISNFRLKKELQFTQTKLSNEEVTLRQQLADKNVEINVLQNDMLILQEKIEQMQQKVQSTRCKKVYSSDIRALIYDMLACQVPTHSVPQLLHKVGEHFGYRFSNIPHRKTVEQMMRELGIISELQAAEIAFSTKNLTLGFDATTQEGVHVNVVHLTNESSCMVVAIDQLAGGTSYDYMSHITKSVNNLAKLYSDFYRKQYTDVRSTIISNITNTMSDRVAVNHATITKLNTFWQKSLNELNCHLHPLDTITSACKSSLKALETSKGKLFGRDCFAANIVVQLNKLRYKDGKGDPKGFVTFLGKHGLPRRLIPRYRGNRLHILFHTCGTLIHHYQKLQSFLFSGVVLCGGLRNSLFQDFTSDTGIREMCLWHTSRLGTGPWMKKFYVASGQGLDYLSGIQVIKNVCNALVESSAEALSLIHRKTDFFGGDLNDPVFQSLIGFCPRTDEMRDALASCLNAVISVINRQYERQFTMTLTDQLKSQTLSARSHNIDCEELVGMFSAAKQKAPNATLCYLSSKIRACKNKTADFLSEKPTDIRNKLIAWSISSAGKKRLANMQCHEEMKAELIKRMAKKIQNKEEKERRKVEKIFKKCVPLQVKQLFPDLENNEAADIEDILNGDAVGRSICHMWYDADTKSQDMYYGRLLSI
nr:uncharacterized protein LOC124816023 [Hydra vulgaris]